MLNKELAFEVKRDTPIYDIKNTIEAKWAIKIPMPLSLKPVITRERFGDYNEILEMIDFTDSLTINYKLDLLIRNLLLREFTFSMDSEAANIANIDAIIKETFTVMSEPIFFDLFQVLSTSRDQAEGTATIALKRPDFLAFIYDVLFFKGEEKPFQDSLITLMNELLNKMKPINNAIFGDIPYLFSYASYNSRLSLFAIDRQNNLHPLTEVFELNKASERLRLSRCIVNMCKFIEPYKRIINSPSWHRFSFKIGSWIPRKPDGVWIYFDPDYAKKKIHNVSIYKYAKVDHLKQLYGAIKAGKITNVIDCTELNHSETLDKFEFQMRPVCPTYVVESLSDLCRILIDIATGVKSLHDNIFLHRDIRWPNVVYNHEKDKFVLIDFEHSSTVNDSVVDKGFSNFLAPALSQGGTFTKDHDWYMFGILIKKALPTVMPVGHQYRYTHSSLGYECKSIIFSYTSPPNMQKFEKQRQALDLIYQSLLCGNVDESALIGKLNEVDLDSYQL
jgi:hypothetical protein